jgi:hypothetical protein
LAQAAAGVADTELGMQMKIVLPNCRIQFTPDDFALISMVLGGGRSLEQLLQDEDTLPEILDDPSLVAAIQDSPSRLRMSAHLYFYLLTRNVLREVQLLNRDVAEYLAELLVYFADARHLKLRVDGQPACEYFYEMLMLLRQADAETAFSIRAYIANYALLMVGLFPERIEHRAARSGAPSVRYYAGLGMSNYQVASRHKLASQYAVADLFSGLAANFELVCQALQRLSDRYLFL